MLSTNTSTKIKRRDKPIDDFIRVKRIIESCRNFSHLISAALLVHNYSVMYPNNLTEITILNGELDWEPNVYSNYTANDIKYHWDDYNEETLKEIINFCIKKELSLSLFF